MSREVWVLREPLIVVDRRLAQHLCGLWPGVVRELRRNGAEPTEAQAQFIEMTGAMAKGVPFPDGCSGRADPVDPVSMGHVPAAEIADRYRVTPRTVRNWANKPGVVAARHGGRLYVDPDSVAEFLADRDAS